MKSRFYSLVRPAVNWIHRCKGRQIFRHCTKFSKTSS